MLQRFYAYRGPAGDLSYQQLLSLQRYKYKPIIRQPVSKYTAPPMLRVMCAKSGHKSANGVCLCNPEKGREVETVIQKPVRPTPDAKIAAQPVEKKLQSVPEPVELIPVPVQPGQSVLDASDSERGSQTNPSEASSETETTLSDDDVHEYNVTQIPDDDGSNSNRSIDDLEWYYEDGCLKYRKPTDATRDAKPNRACSIPENDIQSDASEIDELEWYYGKYKAASEPSLQANEDREFSDSTDIEKLDYQYENGIVEETVSTEISGVLDSEWETEYEISEIIYGEENNDSEVIEYNVNENDEETEQDSVRTESSDIEDLNFCYDTNFGEIKSNAAVPKLNLEDSDSDDDDPRFSDVPKLNLEDSDSDDDDPRFAFVPKLNLEDSDSDDDDPRFADIEVDTKNMKLCPDENNNNICSELKLNLNESDDEEMPFQTDDEGSKIWDYGPESDSEISEATARRIEKAAKPKKPAVVNGIEIPLLDLSFLDDENKTVRANEVAKKKAEVKAVPKGESNHWNSDIWNRSLWTRFMMVHFPRQMMLMFFLQLFVSAEKSKKSMTVMKDKSSTESPLTPQMSDKNACRVKKSKKAMKGKKARAAIDALFGRL